jgi:hypothetical protein
MVSARKRAANRANARNSAGPKTADGRARAAGNALRHGLSAMRERETAPDRAIEALAQDIVGRSGDSERLALARRIAEAEIELRRVRRLLTPRVAAVMDQLAAGVSSGRRKLRAERAPEEASVGPDSVPGRSMPPNSTAASLEDPLDDLRRLERYQQRAWSRRAMAVRALDAVIARQTPMF